MSDDVKDTLADDGRQSSIHLTRTGSQLTPRSGSRQIRRSPEVISNELSVWLRGSDDCAASQLQLQPNSWMRRPSQEDHL